MTGSSDMTTVSMAKLIKNISKILLMDPSHDSFLSINKHGSTQGNALKVTSNIFYNKSFKAQEYNV